MKLGNVIVDAMLMELRVALALLERNSPVTIKLPAYRGFNALQPFCRRCGIKSHANLVGVRVDPELFDVPFRFEQARHPRIKGGIHVTSQVSA